MGDLEDLDLDLDDPTLDSSSADLSDEDLLSDDDLLLDDDLLSDDDSTGESLDRGDSPSPRGTLSEIDSRNTMLAGAVGIALSGFLPVLVLYEPDVTGALGDTYLGAIGGYWQFAFISILMAGFPLGVAFAAGRSGAGRYAAALFFYSLVLLVVLALPVAFIGSILAVIPWSGLLRFVKHSGFRAEVGPGAWLAMTSAAALMIASARQMESERLESLRLGWIIPRRRLNWQTVTAAAAVFILVASLRVVPWVSLTGSIKGVLPVLGPIDQSGDLNWPAGFLPAAGAFEFAGILALAAGLLVLVLRPGVLGPLFYTLGGWLALVASGLVGSFTLGGPEINESDLSIGSVVIEKIHAETTRVTFGVVGTALTGAIAIGLGLYLLRQSESRLVGG